MIRRLIFFAAIFFSLFAGFIVWSISPGAGIPVLTYHHIGDGAEWYYVSAADFELQMKYLQQLGYTPVSVTELSEGLSGRRSLPSRSIVITFDDGYEDNYLSALPILEKLGMRATFFVVTGRMGQPGYMKWQQAKEMGEHGMEVGSHTVNHYTLNEINLKELERELLVSRLMLENNVPAAAPIFANPFGETAPAVVELLGRTGYAAACSSVVGINKPGENLYMIRRISIPRPNYGLWDFRVRLWRLNIADRWGV